MFRLLGPGLLGLLLLGLWFYCLVDVIATDDSLVRNLPKVLWLVVVFFVPTVGALLWLGLGRPAFAGWRPGDSSPRPRPPGRRSRGPEDEPDFGGPPSP